MNAPGSVAIIGAGIAGLSCARRLHDAGWNTTVFEKSRGPGGRMSTRQQTGRDDWQCDHGAQYFTAQHKDFVKQVQQWLDLGVVAPWRARLQVFGAHEHSQRRAPERFVGVPRMTSPAQQLAQDLTILCNTRVSRIRRTTEGWFVQQESGAKSGPFDWLVLAIPAQQAQALLVDDGDCISAPAVLASCEQFPLQPCWALMVELAQPLRVNFDAAFVNPETDTTIPHVLSWIARDNSKPRRFAGETWLLHASEAWSLSHLEDNNDEVSAAMLGDLVRLLGQHPEVRQMHVHRWRYARQAQVPPGPGCVIDTQAQLGLCGDWLNGGRVEGAWLSGQHLAQQLLHSALLHTNLLKTPVPG